MGVAVMTFEGKKNLAGITTSDLLEKIKAGEPFFVPTSSPNVTRVLLSLLKKRYQLDVTTTPSQKEVCGSYLKPNQQ